MEQMKETGRRRSRPPNHGPNITGSHSIRSGDGKNKQSTQNRIRVAEREHILKHISDHRITFIQGETGCGNTTSVPQFILDDASARGRRNSVRVIVAQPRRVAAISLAEYVAKSRGEPVGTDVGFAVAQQRAFTSGRTRLIFVTAGYLMEWLARDLTAGNVTHIILDEVHVRSLEQDLLILLLKLLFGGIGNSSQWQPFYSTKLIIMSATMDVRPLQKYFTCLLKTEQDQDLNPIVIRGRTFPVTIVYMDEIQGYLPGLPKTVADLCKRFLESSGTGKRALDGSNLPHFVIDLITGLVMHVGRAGDCILVFVASFSDISEIQQGFERAAKSRDAALPPLDVLFLHSLLTREDQATVIAPSHPGTLKVIIATNIAESSLTIANLRVVLDLGHQIQIDYSQTSGGKISRVWCSKASATQRAGRVGRLFPGLVIRLYTQETFNHFSAQQKPDIALQNLGSNVLRVESLFRSRFPNFSVVKLLQQLLEPPQPEDVRVSLQELQTLGAITMTRSPDSWELTLLGRLAVELSPDVHLARFVLLGVAAGCGVDCVVMAAGISLQDDIFTRPFLFNSDSVDPVVVQQRRIENLKARLHFDGQYASNLLAFCQIYHEWVNIHSQSTCRQWIARSEFKQSALRYFLLLVREYAEKTLAFVTEAFGVCMENELVKLRMLAAVDPYRNTKYARRHQTIIIPKFSDNLAVVQMVIAGGFAQNWLIGFPAKNLQGVAEIRELEKSNMPAQVSFKLTKVPQTLAGPDIQKLEMALKVLGPVERIVPSCERAVLVQCGRQQKPLTSFPSLPVIANLPDMALLASYMAEFFSRNGQLVINRKDKGVMEEINVGHPSNFRSIKWKVMIGTELWGVRFNRFNLIPRSVEVRKDVSFHIAVAVKIPRTYDASEVLASNVTVLPHDGLFSVLTLLMFRPLGREGEIQVRLLSNSDRIYSIRYQGVTLELAPRFICVAALRRIDGLRAKIMGLVTGVWNCNLFQDLVSLNQDIQATEYGVPLLSPELGLWLEYPSFTPVEPALDKGKSTEDRIHNQSKLCLHDVQVSGSASTFQDKRSCPVLVQSRNDRCITAQRVNLEESAQLNTSKSSALKIFEESFEAAALDVDKAQLIEWIGGNKCYNGIFFELLKKLVRNFGHKDLTKVALQYVYSRAEQLINRKQKSQMEGLYHSICNPDLVSSSPTNAIGAEAAQRVQLQTRKSQVHYKVVNSFTPEINGDSFITRQVMVNHREREKLISALQNQHFAARISVGCFSSSQRSGLVTISGKTSHVEQALQGIETIISKQEKSTGWIIDDTYIESRNMDEKIRCVHAHGCQDFLSTAAGDKSVEFVLVRQAFHDKSYTCGLSSLFNARMKERFDEAMVRLGQLSNVKVQARLGRVVFGCAGILANCLPFRDGQCKPLGELRKHLDRYQISKRRFDDTIPDKDFHYLRAGLHLCNPKYVERENNFVIVVSNPTARDKRGRIAKLKITDAIETPIDAPGRFRLQSVEWSKTKLAVADIVRLNTGATQVDVRLSLQAAEEDYDCSEEAHEFVRKIIRKGSKLEFPLEPYEVRLQREKDSEIFWFGDLKVTLTNTIQTDGGDSRRKNEVEFEAIRSGAEVSQAEMTIPLSDLTSKIHGILEQVQSLCCQLSLRGPSSTATAVIQALLLSWKIHHDEILIRNILIREFLLVPWKANARGKVAGGDQEQISAQICNLVELLCHCDRRILKSGIDVAAELQLVVLHIIQSMNISLSTSMEGRVKWLLANNGLEPENALQYASLLKCCCSPLDLTWDSVLGPYIMQLTLENQSNTLENFFSRVNLCNEALYYSSMQLIDLIMHSSIWNTLSALRRIYDRQNVSIFLKLLHVVLKFEETLGATASLVRCFIRDLLGFCSTKAPFFVGKCLEWIVENEFSLMDLKIHMQNMFWLLKTIKMMNLSIDERCRSDILTLLLNLPWSLERKRDLEEALLDTYGVDEIRFRHIHYETILHKLGHLNHAHKMELQRRGLSANQCCNFNFQSWNPGKIHGEDIMGSSLIPGMNEKGTRLVGSRGIFIPARDPSGQITGGQIKVDDNSTGKRKYVWLSSNKLFTGGKGPQIGGELPLFCCIPETGDVSIVGLCEGGLKAHILAALSGLPVIGASGADFTRSQNLLHSYLAMMDVEQIIFFPDAGSQCNDQVTSCYFQTFRLLRALGYNVRVAWWGQVNKIEHDDIDDYLLKNTCATEFPLLTTFQFWQCVSPDVRESIQGRFAEYKTPEVPDVATAAAQEAFTDEDQIKIVRVMKEGGSYGAYYQITIPKEIMKKMPSAPDDYVTPQSVQTFTIEVLMVQINDPVGVEAAIYWLLPESGTTRMLGLDCEHGFNGDLNLVQVSTHQRCVLIQLSGEILNCHSHSRLASVLRDKKILKSGAEVHNDALAIYHTLGLMVNGLKNVSPAYTTANRTGGMLDIFRTLYGWEWTKKKAITTSDWSCKTLTLEQIKYAALDAWASRMIALEGPAAGHVPVTCLEDLPEELLKLFARAISNYGILQRKEKTVFETTASISESSRSTLRLLQHDFRSRITSVGSRVELRFNDGQKPAFFQAQTRTGKSVVLSPLNDRSTSLKKPALPIDINSISNVIVDNSKSHNPQFRRLRDVFYQLLCHPQSCPRLLSLALKCGPKIASQSQLRVRSNSPKKPDHAAQKCPMPRASLSSQQRYEATITEKRERQRLTRMTASSSENPRDANEEIPRQPECVPSPSLVANTIMLPKHLGKAKIKKKPEGDEPLCTTRSTTKNPQHPGKKTIPKIPELAAPHCTRTNTCNNPKNGKAQTTKKQEDPAFPRDASKVSSKYFEEVFASLNDSQREAVLQILTSPLSATIGPPGTGKTRLITAVAKAWLYARGELEVLVCTAHQNVAARNIAEALTEEQVPGVLLLVSEDYFVDWHEHFYEKLAKSIVVSKAKCELPGALEDWRTKNKRGTVPILVCTLSLVGSPAFMRSLMGGKVTAMVVDECSQAAEGDCVYPLTCLPDLSLLTVLGDPYQLPPFSSSDKSSTSIKVPSIFDLVSNGCEVRLLREQYRMPPTICDFVSQEIYQNELETSPARRNEKDWHHPLFWVNVQGVPTRDKGKTSMYNTAEAEAILQVCQKLSKYQTGSDIVVLTLYEEQNRCISKLLVTENLNETVTVHNIDSFQGQQSDIVLISLVAGKHFSPFAADPNRACVMLTRVKRFLCVYGNHNEVQRNPHALLWHRLANFCSSRGLVASLKDADETFVANLRAHTL